MQNVIYWLHSSLASCSRKSLTNRRASPDSFIRSIPRSCRRLTTDASNCNSLASSTLLAPSSRPPTISASFTRTSSRSFFPLQNFLYSNPLILSAARGSSRVLSRAGALRLRPSASRNVAYPLLCFGHALVRAQYRLMSQLSEEPVVISVGAEDKLAVIARK